MTTDRRRLALVSGATLALMIAGTSIVAARGPGDGPFGDGMRQGGRGGLGPWGGVWGDEARPMLGQRFDSLVSNVTVIAQDDGTFVTRRVDHGTVASVSEAGLSVTLANGQAVDVTTDAETVIATHNDSAARPFRFGWDQVALSEVAAGSETVVWSELQADGSNLARQVIVLPAAATDSTTTPEASPAAQG